MKPVPPSRPPPLQGGVTRSGAVGTASTAAPDFEPKRLSAGDGVGGIDHFPRASGAGGSAPAEAAAAAARPRHRERSRPRTRRRRDRVPCAAGRCRGPHVEVEGLRGRACGAAGRDGEDVDTRGARRRGSREDAGREGVNVTPVGRPPDSERVGVGEPVAVTVKVPEVPTPKLAVLALVILGLVADAVPASRLRVPAMTASAAAIRAAHRVRAPRRGRYDGQGSVALHQDCPFTFGGGTTGGVRSIPASVAAEVPVSDNESVATPRRSRRRRLGGRLLQGSDQVGPPPVEVPMSVPTELLQVDVVHQ